MIDHIFTRENAPAKPDPSAVLGLMRELSIGPDEAVMVGDFWPDIETGENAGIRTVLIPNENLKRTDHEPTAVIHCMTELIPLLDSWKKQP